MAGSVARRLGSGRHQERSSVAMDQSKTTSTETTSETAQNFKVYRSESGATLISRCHRRSRWESVPKSSIRSPEERLQREATCTRYKLPKQIHQGPQISYGLNEAGTISATEKRIRRFHRPQGRLLARSHPSALSKILSVRCPRTTVRLQGHALRIKSGTPRFYQTDESCSNKVAGSGCGSDNVPRRLAYNSQFSRRMRGNGKKDVTDRENYGTIVQYEKIQTRPNKIDGMAWSHLEHRARNSITLAGQPQQVPSEDPKCPMLIHLLSPTVGESGRFSKPRSGSGSLRSHSDAQNALRRAKGVHIRQPRSSSSVPMEDQETTQVVDAISAGIRGQVDARPPLDNPSHGCVGRRLGLSNIRGTPRSRLLGGQEQDGSHQCEGAASSSNSSSKGTRANKPFHPCSVGQHLGGTLHQQARILQVSQTADDIGETLPKCSKKESPFIGFASTGEDELLVRRSIETCHHIRRVVFETGNLSGSDEESWCSGYRSVRDETESETSSLPDSNRENSSRRTRRTDRGLEPVELHLPVSPSSHNSDAPGNKSTPELQRAGSPHRSAVESTTMGSNATPSMSLSRTSVGTSAQRDIGLGIHEILGSTRVEFLKRALSRSLPEETVRDIVLGLRTSTTRQYESSWKKFQKFVEERKYSTISAETVLEFASYLFHKKKLAISTISGHISAIADPLKFAFDISTDSRSLDLMKSSFFLQRPPARKPSPSWSIQKVLNLLSSDQYVNEVTTDNLLKKALFLVALASGLRVSQLRALTRAETLTRFTPDLTQVTLAPNPQFIAKNERLHHRMKPVIVPALIEGGSAHTLCPVRALREYMNEVAGDEENLWIWPRTQQAISTAQIAKLICQVIEEADPGKAPTAHDVRGCASSLAFGRSLDPYQVQLAGQWASCSTFVNRYLFPEVTESHCVAMGSLPA